MRLPPLSSPVSEGDVRFACGGIRELCDRLVVLDGIMIRGTDSPIRVIVHIGTGAQIENAGADHARGESCSFRLKCDWSVEEASRLFVFALLMPVAVPLSPPALSGQAALRLLLCTAGTDEGQQPSSPGGDKHRRRVVRGCRAPDCEAGEHGHCGGDPIDK